MKKEVTIIFNNVYRIFLEEDWVSFKTDHGACGMPLEVFYQMWQSDELIYFMEAYHQKRKTDDA